MPPSPNGATIWYGPSCLPVRFSIVSAHHSLADRTRTARSLLLRYATTAQQLRAEPLSGGGDSPSIVAPEGQKANSAGARVGVGRHRRCASRRLTATNVLPAPLASEGKARFSLRASISGTALMAASLQQRGVASPAVYRARRGLAATESRRKPNASSQHRRRSSSGGKSDGARGVDVRPQSQSYSTKSCPLPANTKGTFRRIQV